MYCIRVDCSIHLDRPKSEIWGRTTGRDNGATASPPENCLDLSPSCSLPFPGRGSGQEPGSSPTYDLDGLRQVPYLLRASVSSSMNWKWQGHLSDSALTSIRWRNVPRALTTVSGTRQVLSRCGCDPDGLWTKLPSLVSFRSKGPEVYTPRIFIPSMDSIHWSIRMPPDRSLTAQPAN